MRQRLASLRGRRATSRKDHTEGLHGIDAELGSILQRRIRVAAVIPSERRESRHLPVHLVAGADPSLTLRMTTLLWHRKRRNCVPSVTPSERQVQILRSRKDDNARVARGNVSFRMDSS